MVKLERDGPRACKQILPVSPDVMAGYKYLHTNEGAFNRKAIEAMPEAVATWYGYLALFVELLTRGNECSDYEDAQACTARMLKLHFAVASCGTSKIVLDLILAGHYAQSYALLRNMLETWLQIVYLRLNPSVAAHWMGKSDDLHLHEPSSDRVLNSIKNLTKNKDEKANVAFVESMIKQLNQGTHPSRLLVGQTRSLEPGVSWLGGNFDLDRLREAMNIGTMVTVLHIHEIERLFELDDAYRARFEQLRQERNAWCEAEPIADLGLRDKSPDSHVPQ